MGTTWIVLGPPLSHRRDGPHLAKKGEHEYAFIFLHRIRAADLEIRPK
jgi:hypothetical protein